MQFTKSTKFRAPKMAKLAILELLDSPKLISRKIWVTEKSWLCNSHSPLNLIIFMCLVSLFWLTHRFVPLRSSVWQISRVSPVLLPKTNRIVCQSWKDVMNNPPMYTIHMSTIEYYTLCYTDRKQDTTRGYIKIEVVLLLLICIFPCKKALQS